MIIDWIPQNKRKIWKKGVIAMEEVIAEEVVKTEVVRVANEGFEVEYENAVTRKANLRAELEAKFEAEFASKAEVFNRIIELTSHEEEVVVEVPEAEEETPVEE